MAAAGRRAGAGDGAGRRGPGEDRLPFRPHLTLARARPARPGRPGPPDLRPFVAALEPFRGTAWTAAEMVLVRSRLPASGVPGEQPRYEPLAAWPLGG